MSTDKFKNNLQPRIRLTHFDGSHELSHIAVDLSSDGDMSKTIKFAGATWEIKYVVTLVDDIQNGQAEFIVTEGSACNIAVAIEWLVTPWSRDNFVMMPAAVYNGNRYPCRNYTYPPMVHEKNDIGLDAPVIITDVPRLNADDNATSRIQLLTGDVTTPCISFYDANTGYAMILLTEQGSIYGNHGLTVEENRDRTGTVLRVEAPGVRRDTLYTMMNTATPSWDKGVELTNGKSIAISFRLYQFPATSIQDLYNRFALVRKDISGEVVLKHELPYSAAWKIIEEKYQRDNWCDEGFYRVGTHEAAANSKFHNWQIGWVGGGMVTLPLLMAGTPESKNRAIRNIDWIFSTTQLENGLFHAVRHKGLSYGDGFDIPGTETWYMVRKQADALYFLIKTFMALQAQDKMWQLPTGWENGTKKLADLFVANFKKYGQLGQYFDCVTGEVIIGGSTAAAMVPGALALAGQFYENAGYIETAEALAEKLDIHVQAGITIGGPGEILKCADSESAFAMLESFIILYETTGKQHWLARAEAMATQSITWCASYDYTFPPDSWFGRLDIRAAGSVWANVQNKHSAPGPCTLSGDTLFKLFRYTGNMLYLKQIQETAHNITQYLCRTDKQIGDPSMMKPGYMCERVNFSDWEEKENIGGSLFGSCWPEVTLMLTLTELPGIYLQTDTGFFCVFDHVNVKSVNMVDGKTTLEIENPTVFDAEVRIFAEKSTDSKNIPGKAEILNWKICKIGAGETEKITI